MHADHWHIDRIEVENFRCFEQLSIDLHPKLTVLVGLNGNGKTALLDAMSVELAQRPAYGGRSRARRHAPRAGN